MRRSITSMLLGTAMAGGLAMSAQAHVVLSSDETAAGGDATLTISVGDGCGESPTTALTIQIPDRSADVSQRVASGFSISTRKRVLDPPIMVHGQPMSEAVSEITWQGGHIPHDAYEEFQIKLKLPDAAGATLHFVAHQQCEDGEILWDDVPEEGQSPWSLEAPAPWLTLTEAPAAQ